MKKKLLLQDCVTYLDLVIGYVSENFSPEIYAYTTSFGSYLTLLYLTRQGNPFRKIILRSPALNLYDSFVKNILTAEDREKLQKGREAQVGFDRKVPVSPQFLQSLADHDIRKFDYLDYAEDILILHGTADEIVPMEMARTFCEDQLIEFVPVDGADHRFRNPHCMDLAMKHILEFFRF